MGNSFSRDLWMEIGAKRARLKVGEEVSTEQ
jgi:hypothetical protein